MTGSTTYRVTVRGRLSDRFAEALDGVVVESADGVTVLLGRLEDQAQLHGLLNRLRDLNVELVRLEQVDA